jgi:hypothetical protein
MSKTLRIQAHGIPERIGFFDRYYLDDSNGICIAHGAIRTDPNPYRHELDGTTTPWDSVPYFRLAAGTYSAAKYDSPKHGDCILLAEGNSLQGCGSKKHGDWIEIHIAGLNSENRDWPGSAGCLTIPWADWQEFIDHFAYNESITIILERF